METARPFAPESRRQRPLRFAFMYEKGGKGPGFRDSTGEYRDTRTGWLRSQSRANPSPPPNSLLNRERTGNFVESAANRRHVTSNRWLFSIGYESNSLTIGTGNFCDKSGTRDPVFRRSVRAGAFARAMGRADALKPGRRKDWPSDLTGSGDRHQGAELGQSGFPDSACKFPVFRICFHRRRC
jgi:hypothetical protein